jgi:hypothetical protein
MLVHADKWKMRKLHPMVLYEDDHEVRRRALEYPLLDEEESTDP